MALGSVVVPLPARFTCPRPFHGLLDSASRTCPRGDVLLPVLRDGLTAPPGGGSRRLCSGPWRLNVSALFYGHFKFDMSKAIAPGVCALPWGSWPRRPGPAGLTPDPAGLTPDPGTAALDL